MNLPDLTDEKTRAYVYRVIAALIPVLVVVGVVGPEDAAVWLGLAAAVFGFGAAGLASKNTHR